MALTREDIERLLGPVDDHRAAEIAATGASAEELARAVAWLEADEALVNDGEHLPTGAVADLIGILEADEEEGVWPGPVAPSGDDL